MDPVQAMTLLRTAKMDIPVVQLGVSTSPEPEAKSPEITNKPVSKFTCVVCAKTQKVTLHTKQFERCSSCHRKHMAHKAYMAKKAKAPGQTASFTCEDCHEIVKYRTDTRRAQFSLCHKCQNKSAARARRQAKTVSTPTPTTTKMPTVTKTAPTKPASLSKIIEDYQKAEAALKEATKNFDQAKKNLKAVMRDL
jgi:hypothetical protein